MARSDLSAVRTARYLLVLYSVLPNACVAPTDVQVTGAVAVQHAAIFSNGGFEGDQSSAAQPWTNLSPAPASFGPEYAPPAPWTVSTFLNNTGLLQVPPASVSDLRLSAGGWPATLDVNNTQCTSSGLAATISAVTAADITLTGLVGMSPRMVGLYLRLSNANNAGNDGLFQISTYVNATSVHVASTTGVLPESSNGNIHWSLAGCVDNDVSLVYPLFGAHSAVVNAGDGPGPTATGNLVTVAGCGSGGTACTLAVAAGIVTLNNPNTNAFTAGMVGNALVITGASNAANNGYFYVKSRVNNHTLTFANPGGVAETFAGNYAVNAGGMNNNVNVLSQTLTIGPGDIDPADGQVHIRWVMAPVLQNPGHTSDKQPYFFYIVTDQGPGGAGPNVVLGHDFNFAAQAGVPWQTANVTAPDGTTVQTTFTDWQLIDIAPGPLAATGDQVQLDLYVSGCQPAGHWARVYVDAFGAVIPGFVVSASGPAYYWLDFASPTNDMTYTLRYENNSGASVVNPEIDFSVPVGTSFVSATDSNGYVCASFAASGSGVKVSAVAGSQATLTGLSGMSATNVGMYLTLSGAANAGNNGFFKVTSVLSATSVIISNGSAVVENAGGTNIAWSYGHVRCQPPGGVGTLPASGSGTVAITVNIATTTEGVLTEASYWTQGKGVSPLFGAAVKTVVSGPPATVVVKSGGGQSTTVNTAFAAPLVAEVDDKNGFAVMNASVSFATPGSGAAATLGTASGKTDANGQLQTTASANTVAGSYNVNASATGVGAPAAFALTNTAGAASTISVTSGGGESGIVSKAFPLPIVVTVTDAFGNPVSGKTVTFTAPAAGASATFPGGPFTTVAGQVSVTPHANATAGGPYTVTAAVTGGGPSTTFTLTNLATTPPPTLLLPANNAFVGSTGPTLSGTALAGATVSVTVDGVAAAATVSGTSFSLVTSGLAPGVHTWSATQTLSGATSTASAPFTFTIDTSLPSLSIGVATPTNTTTPTVSGVANDANLDHVDVVIYRGSSCSGTPVDSGSLPASGSPFSYSFAGYATALTPDGTYVACATAVDHAGNLSPQQSQTFVVDTSAPASSFATASGAFASAPLAVLGGAIDGSGSGVASGITTVEVRVNGGAWQAATLTDPTHWSLSFTPPSGDGTYTLETRATDAAGNVQQGPYPSITLVYDTTPPVSVISTPPAEFSTPTLHVTGTAQDGGSGVVTTQYSLDGGVTWQTATLVDPSDWQLTITPPGDGTFTVSVRSVDAAGNIEVIVPSLVVTFDAACASDAMCASPRVCLPSGLCGSCRTDSDCGGSMSCQLGACVASSGGGSATGGDGQGGAASDTGAAARLYARGGVTGCRCGNAGAPAHGDLAIFALAALLLLRPRLTARARSRGRTPSDRLSR